MMEWMVEVKAADDIKKKIEVSTLLSTAWSEWGRKGEQGRVQGTT